MIGGATNPAFILAGFQVHEIEAHIDGRNEASTLVLTGVAVLKSLGLITTGQTRARQRGAVYQDGKGVPLNPRAHRFPCNPTIGGRNLPDLARTTRPMLAEMLKVPLGGTDLLPLIANYADGLFESSGACEAVVAAVQRIVDGQAAGQPVNAQLVRDVLTQHLLPGYLSAYSEALSKAQQKENTYVPAFSITDPGVVDRLNNYSVNTPYTQNRPKQNIEGVADVLLMERKMAEGGVPNNAAPAAIQAYATQLLAAR